MRARPPAPPTPHPWHLLHELRVWAHARRALEHHRHVLGTRGMPTAKLLGGAAGIAREREGHRTGCRAVSEQ